MTDFKKNLGRVRIPWHYLLGLFLIASCANQCTKPCGTFVYTNLQVQDTPNQNGIEMTLDFDFNPADCGSGCNCNKVCYVQMVRGVKKADGTYLYPSAEKQERATANGWYIDRVEGKIWGYYGRNDDGTFGTNLTPGSDLVNAQLYDFPKRPENDTWNNFTWSAVSVPVCIDNVGSDCNNQLLGYYSWNWVVNDDGSVVAPLNWNAAKALKADLDQAIAAWNLQAPGLGKNEFPTFTRLSE